MSLQQDRASRHDAGGSTGQSLMVGPISQDDWSFIWPLLKEAFADGDSYPCPVDMLETDARAYWLAPSHLVFVARSEENDILGTYYLRTDQDGLGDHICNCGFVVAKSARGQGLAGLMCAHAETVARQKGYLGMRFNLVVATNRAGLRAWSKAGFQIVGTVPRAFRHRELGLVDAHIMFKWISDNPGQA